LVSITTARSRSASPTSTDGDGDLDLLVGQTFFRYSPEQKAGRTPQLRLFINHATAGRDSITVRLRGDGATINHDALGAVVRVILPDGTTMQRQLIGIGGHAGKQHDFVVHFGLGSAERAREVVVQWPNRTAQTQRFTDVAAGRYTLTVGGELQLLGDGQ
jgi:hypothetical protein